ncbi:hypothetical protein X801_03540, partial [Opisthorchis viverrini]
VAALQDKQKFLRSPGLTYTLITIKQTPALATDSAVPYQATWSETPEYILHVTTAASRDQPPYRVEAHE